MATKSVIAPTLEPSVSVFAAPYAAAGPLVSGTSITPNVIDTVTNKTFVVIEYNRSFFVGTRVRATAVGFTDVFLEGVVVSWDGQTLVMDGDLGHGTGTGTYSNWSITVAGQPGIQGPSGPTGPTGPSGGPVGPQGPPGVPGSVWRNGNGAPANSLGANGDYYLDNVTGNVYLRASSAYSIVANIKGSTGSTGPAGPIGPAGPTGPVVAWRNGTGAPANTLGADGDYYLDSATGNVYQRASGTYSIVANIKGPQGVPGPTGPTGPQGIIADAPSDGTFYSRRNAAWATPPGGGDVQHTLTLTAGAGLTGGGDLSANRSFDVGAGPGITVNPDSIQLTVPVAIANGGTGATTAPAALTSLGAQPVDPELTAIAALASGADQYIYFTGPAAASLATITTSGRALLAQSTFAAMLTTLGGAPLANPVFTGDPQAPTPATADNDTSIATTAFVKAQNYLTTSITATLTVGFTFTPNNVGNFPNPYTPVPAVGNYQYGNNNAAFLINAPANDCAMDIMITNTSTAGAITFSGYTVGAIGDPFDTTNGHRFILSIRRIAGIATYTVKALQ